MGGTDVAVRNKTWGLDDSFHCGATGILTFGGDLWIGRGAEISASGGTVHLVPPITILSGANFRADTAMTRYWDDDDQDGMPNGYEIENGLVHYQAGDASQDADNDGVNNLDEYRAGSKPTDSSDFFFSPPALSAKSGQGQITYSWGLPASFGVEDYAVLYVGEEPINGDLTYFGYFPGDRTLTGVSSPYVDAGVMDGQIYFAHLALVNVTNSGQRRSTLSAQVGTMAGAIEATHPLNDTGITTCGDVDTNNLSCPVAGFPNQDAEFGRDFTQNDDSDGRAGFSFTKLDSNGSPLSATASSWSCVKDNVTGLIWEVKASPGNDVVGDEGLHDADDRFNWYDTNPESNGGADGHADDDGAICFGYQSGVSRTFCNTQAFVARVNAQGYCGYNDWRVPGPQDLISIVDRGRYAPSIDARYFPDSQSTRFWSSSAYANDSNYAWYVYFSNGYDGANYRNSNYAVRLVRGGQ
jgi:hypothetical protein